MPIYKRIHPKKDGRTLLLYGTRPHQAAPLEEEANPPPSGSHLRWHPLRREWVVYAAHRQSRPFLPPANFDPLAPSQPGGFPTEIPFEDFEIAVFQNRFPALSPWQAEAGLEANLSLPTAPGLGDCEVVVYTAEQEGSLASLPADRRELLVRVWADRYQELLARQHIRYVMPFENRGQEVGVTLHHPHGQIYAYGFVPPLIEKEVQAFREGHVLMGLLQEAEPYLVAQNEHCVALVPPFARYPYEVWVIPRRFHPGPWTFSDDETRAFADLLGEVVARYDRLFDRPFPYVMLLHAAPEGEESTYHFHVEFYPPLRSHDKLKYLAGTEIGAGTFVMDALPEVTAVELRNLKVKP